MNASAAPDPGFADPNQAIPVAPELERTEVGLRVLYSLVFAVVLHIAACVLTLLVVIQVVVALITQKPPHQRLTQFGKSLIRYCALVGRYLTFADKRPPFPFADFPSTPPAV